MTLTTQNEINQTWGSHQPLLRAVLTVLRPRSAVECGSGGFSTPLLQSVPYLHTIEHDPAWARKTQKKYPAPPHQHWTVQPFAKDDGKRFVNNTRIHELSPEKYGMVCKWYQEMAEKEPPFDFLFVDTFLSCRVPAAQAFGEKAQVILIHDMEPASRDAYEWNRLDSMLKNWCGYIHRPVAIIAETHPVPWTALYTRDPIDDYIMDKLNKIIRKRSVDLWNMDVGLEEIDHG